MNDYAQKTLEQATANATELGLILVLPESGELQLDLDTPRTAKNTSALNILQNLYGIISDPLFTISKSRNQHCYIRIAQPLTDLESVAWQAALGSDPVREAPSLQRIFNGADFVNCLFETPEEKERIDAWRDNCRILFMANRDAQIIDEEIPF